MKADTVVRARIGKQTRDEAAEALAAIGLSLSDYIRLALKKVAADKEVPFALKVPNAKTATALKKSARGEDVHSAANRGELFAKLES